MKCSEDISVGQVYVNATSLGEDAAWHPACFECYQCHELVADLIYCFRNGHIFCVRHHAEQIKPRCVMCDEVHIFLYYVGPDILTSMLCEAQF